MTPDAASRWRAELRAWAIPAEILAAAPESPYGFPVGMFTAEPEPADTPSHRRAREVLPVGGTVLDVGCGGGSAAMALVPPAGLVIGVDEAPHMVEAFAEAASARGVAHREVLGSWPEVAADAGKADVVVAHHVTYNVPDLVPFARALAAAASGRVVVEMTDVHPWVPTNDLWRRFHDLSRPAGPSAQLCAEVLTDAGLDVHTESWQRPARRTDRAQTVAFIRRRLCLPVGAEPDVDAALSPDYQFALRGVTTLWWDTGSEDGSELGGQYVDRLDVRRRAEQIVRLFHQSGSDRAVEVCLPAVIAGEDVEDAVRRVVELDREPRGGVRFLLREWQRALQEGGQLLLLARLRSERYLQTLGDHDSSPVR